MRSTPRSACDVRTGATCSRSPREMFCSALFLLPFCEQCVDAREDVEQRLLVGQERHPKMRFVVDVEGRPRHDEHVLALEQPMANSLSSNDGKLSVRTPT